MPHHLGVGMAGVNEKNILLVIRYGTGEEFYAFGKFLQHVGPLCNQVLGGGVEGTEVKRSSILAHALEELAINGGQGPFHHALQLRDLPCCGTADLLRKVRNKGSPEFDTVLDNCKVPTSQSMRPRYRRHCSQDPISNLCW